MVPKKFCFCANIKEAKWSWSITLQKERRDFYNLKTKKNSHGGVLLQRMTNVIFAWTDFRADKMVLRARSCTQNYVHKWVTVGAFLHRLVYSVLIDNLSPYILNSFNIKTYQGRYAQHKGFSRFKWTSAGGLKIDQIKKLR